MCLCTMMMPQQQEYCPNNEHCVGGTHCCIGCATTDGGSARIEGWTCCGGRRLLPATNSSATQLRGSFVNTSPMILPEGDKVRAGLALTSFRCIGRLAVVLLLGCMTLSFPKVQQADDLHTVCPLMLGQNEGCRNGVHCPDGMHCCYGCRHYTAGEARDEGWFCCEG